MLGDTGIRIIANDGLRHNNGCLQRLYLQDTGITGADGCRAIATALAGNPKSDLQYLDLSHNPDIGDDGATEIAHGAIANNASKLQELVLACNNIGDVGCVAIAKSLRTNNLLTKIDMQYNPRITGGTVGSGGSALEISVRQYNYSLRQINLQWNENGPAPQKRRIDDLCKINRRLRCILDDEKLLSISTTSTTSTTGSTPPVVVVPWPSLLERFAEHPNPSLLFAVVKTVHPNLI